MHELIGKASVFVEKLNTFTEQHKKLLLPILSALAVIIIFGIGFTVFKLLKSPNDPPL